MAIVNYGRHSSLPRIDFGFIAPGQMRGNTFNAASQHLWCYQLGIWAGKYTTADPDNVTTRVAIYATDGSMNPTDRLGYSASMTVTAVMNDIAGGASNVASVATVDVTAPSGVTLSAIPLSSGVRYHLAVLGTTGSLGHAMQAASRITANNERFYNRTGLGQPPPDPFGAYVSSTEGHMAIWAVCDDNVAPDTPTSLAPAGTINETTPTFTAAFNDDNENRGDYLNQFRVQVRRKSDGVTFWNTTLTANSGERTADAFSRAYAGTTLIRGTEYEWRTQMSDHFGTWSSWTAWTSFLPANLGFVTVDGDPTGKIEDNTPDFDGKWTHQASEDMTHAQVRIWNASGSTILQTGAEYDLTDVASAAPPGTDFTLSWADVGLTTLPWGNGYQYQIRGKDESALYSDWSSKRSFSTNAAPSVPSNLSPANSLPITNYPLLTCTATDIDDTDATGLVVKARIKDAGGSLIDTVDMTYNSSTGKWEYQTTSSELASYATYKWDAYSYDGTLYSGEQTVEGSAAKSGEATFIFAEGPQVVVTTPLDQDTITTADLAIEWTVSDQQKYRIYLYDDATSDLVYDSGVVISTTSEHTIPTGYLRNGVSYELVVWVEDGNPLEGQSPVISLDVAFTPADMVANFQVELIKVTTDIWPSAVRLTWDQTGYGTDVWQEYVLKRRVGNTEIVLLRTTSPSDVAFIDYFPPTGTVIYSVTQSILTGLDILDSDPAESAVEVTLGGIVLCSVTDPEGTRTALRYTGERDFPRTIDEHPYYPLDGSAPTTVRARTHVLEPSFDAKIFDDDGATAAVRRAELERIDQSGHTLCYRDNHGRKLFVTMPDLTITDQVPDWFQARVGLRAERFVEGAE